MNFVGVPGQGAKGQISAPLRIVELLDKDAIAMTELN